MTTTSTPASTASDDATSTIDPRPEPPGEATGDASTGAETEEGTATDEPPAQVCAAYCAAEASCCAGECAVDVACESRCAAALATAQRRGGECGARLPEALTCASGSCEAMQAYQDGLGPCAALADDALADPACVVPAVGACRLACEKSPACQPGAFASVEACAAHCTGVLFRADDACASLLIERLECIDLTPECFWVEFCPDACSG